jgi:hemerythrin-like domain-containing protein
MVMGIPARILENIDYAIEKGQLDVADLKLIIDNIESFIDDLENQEDEE